MGCSAFAVTSACQPAPEAVSTAAGLKPDSGACATAALAAGAGECFGSSRTIWRRYSVLAAAWSDGMAAAQDRVRDLVLAAFEAHEAEAGAYAE